MNNIEVYHQCGFRDVWNFAVYEEEEVGEGFIFAPKMASVKKLQKITKDIRTKSFFDPQFFWPRSKEKKFSDFDFFPQIISEGYSTTNYVETCYQSADMCIDFQLRQEYKFLIIPTIVYDETPQNYLEILRCLYIDPFLKAISEKNTLNKKVLLSVVIKDTQLVDEQFRRDMLNLITSYGEIDGIYLIPCNKSSTKRAKDIDFIVNLLKFINTLKNNDMYVHLAYTDIEGIIFSLADIDSVSIGIYENMRKFNLKYFKEKEEEKHFSSPNRRIYSNKLFQWIDFDYIGALKDMGIFLDLFENNEYVSFATPNEENWHFKFPELYKHYMVSLYNQYKELPSNYSERYTFVHKALNEAVRLNKLIEEDGILLDNNSNGDHIYKWVTAINMYNKYLKGE